MQKLQKISFFASLLLIFILYIITANLSPNLTSISEISEKDYNNKVKIQGQIVKIRFHDNFQTLTIQDSTDKINVLSNIQDKNINLTKIKNKNQTLEIIARVDLYNGKLQLKSEKIKESNYSTH